MKSRIVSSARRTGRPRTFVTIAQTIGMCPDSWADEASDIRAGQELASKVCSPCHVVAERPGPTFAEIAKGGRAAPDTLLAFLRSTHSNVSHPGGMPNPELTERQIEQISAYLESLRAMK